MSTRIRSKRQAEYEAYDEEMERDRAAHLLRLATEVREGYASIAPLPLPALEICLRCSAIVYGRERHDASQHPSS